MSDPLAEERVGTVLHDKWTLERLLGVGGMGAVYAARHRNGARAAVKVLSPAGGRIPHIRKRFLHEGYAANRVDHPNAVKVLDDDEIKDGPDEGTAYLVMELLEGESLADRAKRDPRLGERDLLEIADGVLGVLEAAHGNGVVHRDLKPDNLFLAKTGEDERVAVKVLDFGLARLAEESDHTLKGMALGTPTYMSPEQAAGHVDKIDARTDIYALGSILFQLASHQRIHDAAHTLGLVIRMATTPAPKLKTVAEDASEGFARIVDRALQFERDDRYPSAAAMRADVRTELGLGPPSARSLAVATTIPAPEPEKKAESKQAPEATPTRIESPSARSSASKDVSPSRSSVDSERRPILPTLFFLVVLLGGGAFAWSKRQAIAGMVAAASATAIGSVADDSGAALPPVASAEPDAAAEPADAGAVDAGDGGEEEDDDDELEAGAPEGGAPLPPRVRPHPATRPSHGQHPKRPVPGWKKKKRR